MIDLKSVLIRGLSGQHIRAVNNKFRSLVGRGGLRVINFHRVLDNDIDVNDYRYKGESPTVDTFDKILEFLSSSYNLISLKDYVDNHEKIDPGEMYVALTFDDGYLDNYTNALPILKKYSAPATIFVSIDALDGKPLWFQKIYCIIKASSEKTILNPCTGEKLSLSDKWSAMQGVAKSMLTVPINEYDLKIHELCVGCNVSQQEIICESEKMLTWNEMAILKDEPLIDIGSHTVTHFSLIKLQDDELRYELEESFDRLKEAMGYDRVHMAFPNGIYDERVKSFVRQIGYEAAFAMDRGVNTLDTDLFEMKREYVVNDPVRIGFQLDDWDLRLKKIF